jgi:hypothetical protein
MAKTYIFFDDCHHDGGDRVVEATEEEWDALIAPAIAGGYPIDASTVDTDLFEHFYDREDVDLKKSEIDKIEWIVPLV